MNSRRYEESMMSALVRLGVILSICAGVLGALASTAMAQDSARLRALGCGTHGPTLQRREATREVQEALTKVAMCPEGPEVLAKLWSDVTIGDSAFVRSLAVHSSLTERRVASAMIQTVSSRARPASARLAAIDAFLSQLNGEYGAVWFAMGLSPTLDNRGRTIRVDTTWEAYPSKSIPPSRPRPVDAATRAEIVSTLNQVAANASEDPMVRAAARAALTVLPQRQP
jgi:hypothetical protein